MFYIKSCFNYRGRSYIVNLEDVLSDGGLQQDGWSLTEPKFGEEGQLEVVGYIGKQWTNRVYLLTCLECKRDPELFGEGYFKSTKSNLNAGKLPCGCSNIPKWTESQFNTLCERKASDMGYCFQGFAEKFHGQNTKTAMYCRKHGLWESLTVNTLINTDHGCPRCAVDMVKQLNTKPDNVMIESFLSTGAFHPDTKFWRSDRLTNKGTAEFWNIYCPECGGTGQATASNLQAGKACCECSPHRQKEAYMNWIISEDFIAIAIKFGISVNSERRFRQMSKDGPYKVERFIVYKFPDVASCKRAERQCKQELDCGILTKEEMPDGYTETVGIENLFKILEIYVRNGGVCIHGKYMEP